MVVFALALEYATRQAKPSAAHIAWLALVSIGGGIAIGLLTGAVMMPVRRRIQDPVLSNATAILVPFLAYLVAEEIGASGVLAVVVCGLLMAHLAPPRVSAAARTQQARSGPWRPSCSTARSSSSSSRPTSSAPSTGGPGNASCAPPSAAGWSTRSPGSAARCRSPSRWPSRSLPGTAGVSPIATSIVFVTAGVVTTSLVLQGLLLPPVIRWADLPDDGSEEKEFAYARRTATTEAIDALPALARASGAGPDVLEEVAEEYADHLAMIGADGDADPETDERHRQYRGLQLAALAHKRATVVRLRDEQVIDDTVLRRVQSRLDVEELRFRGPGDQA